MPNPDCPICKAELTAMEMCFPAPQDLDPICLKCWETGLLGLAETHEGQTDLTPNYDSSGWLTPRSN
jgi:hypothetical protein